MNYHQSGQQSVANCDVTNGQPQQQCHQQQYQQPKHQLPHPLQRPGNQTPASQSQINTQVQKKNPLSRQPSGSTG